MKSVTRTASARKSRSYTHALTPASPTISIPPAASSPRGPAMSIAEWGAETRALVAEIDPKAQRATLVIRHSENDPCTVIPIMCREDKDAAKEAEVPADTSPAATRARLVAWLIRVASECDLMAAQMHTDRFAHALTPTERQRLYAILESFWGEITGSGALPRDVPPELAQDFPDLAP